MNLKIFILLALNTVVSKVLLNYFVIPDKKKSLKSCFFSKSVYYETETLLSNLFILTCSHLLDHIKPEALKGFNNTGNVCKFTKKD